MHMKPPTYKIWTIQDLLAVPAKRRRECLAELEIALAACEVVCNELHTAPAIGAFKWIDDGKNTGKIIFTPTAKCT